MASANLFQQYLGPVRSVADYAAEMDQADARRQQNAIQALALRRATEQDARAQNAQNALTRIASSWTADTTPDQRIASLRNSGIHELMQQADTLETADLKRQETKAKVSKDQADAGKTQGATMDDALKRYRSALDFIDTPQGAARWFQAQYADPVLGQHMQSLGPLEAVVSSIPQDPQGFANWRKQTALGMTKFQEMQQQREIADQSNATSIANNQRTVGAQMARLAEDRRQFNTRQAGEQQAVTYQQDANGNMVALPTRAAPGTVVRGQPVVAGPGMQPMQGKGSEAVQKEKLSINQQRAVIDGALEAVKATPDAFGFVRGTATRIGSTAETLAGRLDSPQETEARSAVYNIVSKVINERAGAAQSAQELTRLRGFLPAEQDTAEQITNKLNGFKKYLDDLERGTTTRAPAPAAPSAPAAGQFKIIGVQ